METTVINLFGGPGCGKSTIAAGIFTLLKLHGVECELALEFAKDLIWDERFETFKDQHYIFGKQHHRLWRLNGKVKYAITDCPLMLSPIYGERYGTTSGIFLDNVINVVKTYNNFNILLTRTKRYNKNGRNENEAEAKEIDTTIREVLINNGMDWLEVPGNFEGINKIVKMILNKKQRFSLKYDKT